MTTPLSEILRTMIKENGPISIGTFMALCLSHPQYGYYMAREAFGAKGDFTTAPEISQLFGEMIAVWIVLSWEQLGKPDDLQLVELGPGRGTLMKDIWRGLSTRPELRDKLQIQLVEFSPRLQTVQKENLAGLPVTWHTHFEAVHNRPTIILANEFFDALPVEQAIFHQDAWYQRMITADDEDFLFALGAPLQGITEYGMPEFSIFEYAPLATSIMQQLCDFVKKNDGALLAIDYGDDFPLEERFGETIQALHKHKMVDIFELPGESDLTAHVSFASLSAIANEEGCTALPLQTQREFLTQLGIRLRAEKLLASATEDQAKDLQLSLQRLIDPLQMGDLFKVLQVYSNDH
ncbi:MAG: uncharacterized protein JWM96_1294 [Alphaproteobacteria bacterium]|nr:uncharacterized protein [Alphaproteobacteria bacterium]